MARSLFDHLNAICSDQTIDYFDQLEDVDVKTFNVFMVNRFLSMEPQFIDVVNEFQRYYTGIGAREAYLFYSQCLPKGKRYLKYVKVKADEKYESWLIELVAKYFHVSQAEAIDYLYTFYLTESGKAHLRRLCENHCVEPKLIKKAKI